jgi:two-component system response regulator FixJ
MDIKAAECIFGITRSEALRLVSSLTRRELQVAQLMAKGICNSDIAIQLGIGPKTLDIHRANLCKKFGVSAIGVPRILLASQILDLAAQDIGKAARHGA